MAEIWNGWMKLTSPDCDKHRVNNASYYTHETRYFNDLYRQTTPSKYKFNVGDDHELPQL